MTERPRTYTTLDHSQMAEKEDGELTGSQRSSLTNDHQPFTGLRSPDAAFDVVLISFDVVLSSLLGSGGGSGICFETSKHEQLPITRSLKPYQIDQAVRDVCKHLVHVFKMFRFLGGCVSPDSSPTPHPLP